MPLHKSFLRSTTDGHFLQLNAFQGTNNFTHEYECRYCFQLDAFHICSKNSSCSSTSHDYYIASCTVPPSLLCLGSRTFQKVVKCEFTNGYKWSTAMYLRYFLMHLCNVTLGQHICRWFWSRQILFGLCWMGHIQTVESWRIRHMDYCRCYPHQHRLSHSF